MKRLVLEDFFEDVDGLGFAYFGRERVSRGRGLGRRRLCLQKFAVGCWGWRANLKQEEPMGALFLRMVHRVGVIQTNLSPLRTGLRNKWGRGGRLLISFTNFDLLKAKAVAQQIEVSSGKILYPKHAAYTCTV